MADPIRVQESRGEQDTGIPLGENEASLRESLNEGHVRHLLSNFHHADNLLSDVEAILTATKSKSPFPKYIADLTPAQVKVVEDYIARIRSQLVRVLASFDIHHSGPQIGSIHAVRVTLSFIRIAIQESAPKYLAGYGPVPASLIPELNGLSSELEGLINKLDGFLAQGPGQDIQQRLARLAQTSDEIGLLRKIEPIIDRHALVEYRTALAGIVDRLATTRFEVAVFGMVSSGKSSLLNHILGEELLPVGVNPITAVPTRICYGRERALAVTFADRTIRKFPLEEVAEYVTEDRNPANAKGVMRIVATVPAERLQEGVVFVDTPGLGSLATSGAAETKSYLPQCDLGIVLINAGGTMGQEDVATIQALYSAGVIPAVLLSKADLIGPADRDRACTYIQSKLEAELGVRLHVYPVSVIQGHEQMLDDWFSNHVHPLLREGQRLAQESIRRKIGVLRESVVSTLRSKLRSTGGRKAADRPQLEQVDQRLRSAAGDLPEVLRKSLDAADQIRALAGPALSLAAARLLEEWNTDSPVETTAIVRSAITDLVSGEANRIFLSLENTAAELHAALAEAVRMLEFSEAPSRADFDAALGEMPRIDLGGIAVQMDRPFAARFGPMIGQYVVQRRLANAIGAQVRHACVNYGRVLVAWVRDSVAKLERRFDSTADPLRAQIQRLLSPEHGTDTDQEAIKASLHELGELAGNAGEHELARI